ncbi:MAG: sigma-70 family RNA polymerase sigma factor [Oscillospiraceae bacterium]|jgi:RNA polymerase sigma factor (sigma-70 family)|nr:sigma-70 family RNA polymerase sigma factor [Oscillospiraceae bacterium]
MEDKYYLRAGGELVDVPRELYDEYRKSVRRERTQRERDARNGLLYYDGWEGFNIASLEAGAEDELIAADETRRIRKCIEKLEESERKIVQALFYCGKSLTQYARELGVPRKTLEYRRGKVLEKLRELYLGVDGGR